MDYGQFRQMEQGQTNALTSEWTFNQCRGEKSRATHVFGKAPPAQVPFGLVQNFGANSRDCCGDCWLDASEVRP